jgi:CysZ protein
MLGLSLSDGRDIPPVVFALGNPPENDAAVRHLAPAASIYPLDLRAEHTTTVAQYINSKLPPGHLEERHGVDPGDLQRPYQALGLTERVLLELHLSLARGVELIVLSASGLDPKGIGVVHSFLREHRGPASVVSVFSSKHRELYDTADTFNRVLDCPSPLRTPMTVDVVPQPPANRPAHGGFLTGLRAPVEGFSFLLRRPRLWHYALLPILINVVLTLTLFIGLSYGAYRFIADMHAWPRFAASWWGRTQEGFAVLAVVAATLSLIAGSYILLGGILTAWFNERLAKQVEIALGTPASELTELPFRYQAFDAVLNFLKVTLTAAACFFIGCIPVIGFILGGAISFYVDCFIFGYDYLDYPLALRGHRRSAKRAFCRRHRPETLGLGATVLLMNFIPLVGSVFLTTAAAGAVLLHKRLREAEATPVPPTLPHPPLPPHHPPN